MAAQVSNTFGADAITPICGGCGVALCWDVSTHDYLKEKAFWDQWHCQDCNSGSPQSIKRWREVNGI